MVSSGRIQAFLSLRVACGASEPPKIANLGIQGDDGGDGGGGGDRVDKKKTSYNACAQKSTSRGAISNDSH